MEVIKDGSLDSEISKINYTTEDHKRLSQEQGLLQAKLDGILETGLLKNSFFRRSENTPIEV